METSKTIFISYAHEDKKWVKELNIFFSPWVRKKRIKAWDDSNISIGGKWEDELNAALDEANVAVLLVTKYFGDSDYIANKELPIILKRAKNNELKIYWVAIGYADYKALDLDPLQAANDPEKPLESLNKTKRDKFFKELTSKIANSSVLGSLASGLDVLDKTSEPFAAAIENRPEVDSKNFRIKAEHSPKEDHISFTGATETITVKDLEKLSEDDKEFIAIFEDSLKQNYERWSKVRKQLVKTDGTLDKEIEKQKDRIEKLICEDLNKIMNFLKDIYKFELEDHYGRYKFLCQEIQSKNVD